MAACAPIIFSRSVNWWIEYNLPSEGKHINSIAKDSIIIIENGRVCVHV